MKPTLIRGGLVVSSTEVKAEDVLVSGSTIHAVGKNLETPDDARIIDASGCFVLPGGIDAHVHLSLPVGGGLVSGDSWESGTRAALAGGTTTVIDFVTPDRGGSLKEALEERLEEARDACCDYSLHLSITGQEQLEELPALLSGSGCPSVKVYMAYKAGIGIDDALLLRVMEQTARSGGVVLAHCEDGDAVDFLRDRLFAEGKTGPESHPLSRPSCVEEEAVRRAVMYAGITGSELYVVHTSTAGGMAAICEGKRHGVHVHAEVCLHHLFLDESYYSQKGFGGAKYVMSPPLRPGEDVDGLWHYLTEGAVDVLSTDHCPFDFKSSKYLGKDDFRKIPNGVAGVEDRIPVFYSTAIGEDRINWPRFVDLVSERPARIFGLFPQKGVVRRGSDADILIWDPAGSRLYSAGESHQRCDYSIYEGFHLAGHVRYVFSRGEIVAEGRDVSARKGRGAFIPRRYKS